MRRLLATTALALLALCALASAALAATPKPTISSVSPSQVAVGGTLVLKGKNFASGARNNRVFFSRSTDGKSVRVHPKKSSKTRMEVVVPKTLAALLADDGQGGKKATRFRLMIFTKVLGPKTRTSRSPLIFPAGSLPTTGGGSTGTGTGTAPPPPPDCDADGTPDAQDADDDNDGLSDDREAAAHTNPCNKDTDGDGVEDGFEYWSAKDLNISANPYPGKKPYPNALDPADKDTDFDGDGLTNFEEFSAWNLSGRVLPTADGQTFPYSDGNQTSTAAPNAGGTDYDQNGKVTDDEKDADNDGLANWVELARGGDGNKPLWTNPNLGACPFVGSSSQYQDCGAGSVPNGNTFNNLFASYASYLQPNWLDPDTDGDGINDSADDQDHDGLSNAAEIAGTDNPVDPCDPDTESPTCQQHR
jgi:hypothetical protein